MKRKSWLRIAALTLAMVLCMAVGTLPVSAALREGDRGSDVRTVQEKLKRWGYYSGEVDGIYGAQTASAVRAFQKKNGLAVDGIVGTATSQALGMTLSSGSSVTTNYSNEIGMLARMIAAEGRGEPYTGQVAIGAVIMNRVKHPSFPNTISGVLYQSGAFSALSDGQYASTNVPDSCRRAAVEAYNGSDPTYGCIYYYNPAKTSNRFMLSRPIVLTIGDHVFCK